MTEEERARKRARLESKIAEISDAKAEEKLKAEREAQAAREAAKEEAHAAELAQAREEARAAKEAQAKEKQAEERAMDEALDAAMRAFDAAVLRTQQVARPPSSARRRDISFLFGG